MIYFFNDKNPYFTNTLLEGKKRPGTLGFLSFEL